ncbi:5'-3' exonuclease [Candidatus Caldatribacterium sp. SIUC1]|uniref:5'-3' exonuclease n=1 Tax=Candidatus Caldatribacterium sp. SIUC1 TaxID=3418365 RepID=UPI003F68F4B4
MENQKLVIAVDGTSLAYRAFYALPRLTTSSGRPTGATLGFCNMLMRLLEDYSPLTIVVAFDHPKKTFRHALEEKYKVSRKPMPDLLRPQLEDIKEILSYFGFPILEVPGFEGDDLIGSLKECLGGRYLLYVVTSDLDLLQLLDEHTVLLQPVQGVTRLRPIGPRDVEREFGITPAQIVDFLALSGDVSDDIQGVRGIGEKRAAQLLQRFTSWEGILAHIAELPPSLRESLLRAREQVETNRVLVTIRRDVPLDCRVEPWSPERVSWPRLLQKLEELELRRLRERIEKKRQSLYLVLRGRDLFVTDGKDPENVAGIPPGQPRGYLISCVQPDAEHLGKVLETPEVFWGQVLLWVVYPCLFPPPENSRHLEGLGKTFSFGALSMLLEEARKWIACETALSEVYRNVEVPLVLKFALGELSFATGFLDLPLFVPPCAFVVEKVVPPGDLMQRIQEVGGYVALPTLYGWRFVGRYGESREELLVSYENTCREEVFRLLAWVLSAGGVRRLYRVGKRFSADIPLSGDFRQFLGVLSERFLKGRWRLEVVERRKGEYGLLVIGEGE